MLISEIDIVDVFIAQRFCGSFQSQKREFFHLTENHSSSTYTWFATYIVVTNSDSWLLSIAPNSSGETTSDDELREIFSN